MIVSNATALVLFTRIGRLSLLHEVLGELVIPQAVADELAVPGKPGAVEVQAASWIRVVAVRDRDRVGRLPAHLGRGEREAIVLAGEQGATFLSDDGPARRVAREQGLAVTGSLAVLLRAKDRGLIPSVKELLDEMIRQDFRISRQLYREVLQQAGELA